MERGIGAVREYLQAESPGHAVQVLEPGNRDFDRDTRTFKVRDDNTKHLLRIVDEVLDLDAEGVGRLLRAFRVAQVLRQAGTGRAVLATTDTIRVEPISV